MYEYKLPGSPTRSKWDSPRTLVPEASTCWTPPINVNATIRKKWIKQSYEIKITKHPKVKIKRSNTYWPKKKKREHNILNFDYINDRLTSRVSIKIFETHTHLVV